MTDPAIPDLLLTPESAAHALGVAVATLAEWRVRGYGPPYVRVGGGVRGRIRYPADALRDWSAALARHSSTAEYDASPTSRRQADTRQLDLRALVLGEGAGI